MSILIKNVLLHGKKTNVFIEENRIASIGAKQSADIVLNGKDKAILPGFVNTHTHAAMTLFKGYADDLVLQDWLEKKIWPIEAKLKEEDVFWGTKMACLEMIKTGTTCFNDMYWHALGTAKAAKESGLRAVISAVFVDLMDESKAEQEIKKSETLVSKIKGNFPARIQPALGPHAVYTASKKSLEWCRDFSKQNDLLVHLHLSETEKEVIDWKKKTGMTPAEYLNKMNFLSSRLIACHNVWHNKADLQLLSKNGVQVNHNPVSNMKLACGKAISLDLMEQAGLNVCLGTDGSASNNNLDMFDSMKFASLLQKFYFNDPTRLQAVKCFNMATFNGAKALGIEAGAVREGMLADLMLVDLKKPELNPLHSLESNMVYSANGSCVSELICDGKILMHEGKVKGEEKIIREFNKRVSNVFKGC